MDAPPFSGQSEGCKQGHNVEMQKSSIGQANDSGLGESAVIPRLMIVIKAVHDNNRQP